jgi:hypothetical protein
MTSDKLVRYGSELKFTSKLGSKSLLPSLKSDGESIIDFESVLLVCVLWRCTGSEGLYSERSASWGPIQICSNASFSWIHLHEPF